MIDHIPLFLMFIKNGNQFLVFAMHTTVGKSRWVDSLISSGTESEILNYIRSSIFEFSLFNVDPSVKSLSDLAMKKKERKK